MYVQICNILFYFITQVTGGFNNNSVRQNFINQPNPVSVLNPVGGYNSEIPPSTNCPTTQQQQQQQQQFRMSRNINMITASSQIPGKKKILI